MQRYHLSKKITKKINTMFPCADLSKSTKIEYLKDDDLELILIEGTPSFFYHDKIRLLWCRHHAPRHNQNR